MRTLGPRSVASFLKVFLDISFVFGCLVLVSLGTLALVSAYGMATGAQLPDWHYGGSRDYPVFADEPRHAARLLSQCLYVLGGLVILRRLSKVFNTLTAGTPFVFENARRLRVIGLVMAALQASEWLIWALLVRGTPAARLRFYQPDIDLVGIFAIGVMFVLAEVFDEGARMRKDLDLTI